MNAEQSAMLERARSALRVAQAAQEQREYNEAASGAYYAMFHAANAAPASMGLGFSKHSAVIAAFGREFAKTELLPRALHQWLRDAFDTRQEATYDYEVQLEIHDTEPLLDEAEQFIDTIEDYLREETS